MAKKSTADPLLESPPKTRTYAQAKAKGTAGPVELNAAGELVYGGDPHDDLAPATPEG